MEERALEQLGLRGQKQPKNFTFGEQFWRSGVIHDECGIASALSFSAILLPTDRPVSIPPPLPRAAAGASYSLPVDHLLKALTSTVLARGAITEEHRQTILKIAESWRDGRSTRTEGFGSG